MDFEEGLNGYSSFLVSVHWQIAGIIFQTGSIETLTAAITKLLFHLPSKKPGSGLRQKLFAGAGNVFVGFPMRMTLPIASPAAMMGWITWDVDGAGCSSTTGTLPRSLALRHLASLSLITASSWLLINFPMNSLLPGPAAATTWSWSVMQESMPVEWERDSAYSFAKG